MVVLYNLELAQPDQIVLVLAILLLGTLGLSTIGTMLATMTVRSKSRETLLPIVMLPMALPIVVAAVKATAALLAQSAFGAWSAWLTLLVVIAVIYFAASYLMFDFVVEE
jgi:heme exporter protein B